MAATNTFFCVDCRNLSSVAVVHHDDGARRAMACAVAAADAVGGDNAVVLYPNGMSHLDSRLLFFLNGCDGASRAHIGTSGTTGEAVAFVELHLWLHERHQVA